MQNLSLSELSSVAGEGVANPSDCKADFVGGAAAGVAISWRAVLMFVATLTLAVTSPAMASPILVPVESLIKAGIDINEDTLAELLLDQDIVVASQGATINPLAVSASAHAFTGNFAIARVSADWNDADFGNVTIETGWNGDTTGVVFPDFSPALPQWQYSFRALTDSVFNLSYSAKAFYTSPTFPGLPLVYQLFSSFSVLWDGTDVRDIADSGSGALAFPLVAETDYKITILSRTTFSDSREGA